MNRTSLNAFRKKAHAVSRSLRPGTVRLGDATATYQAAVWHGSETIENDRGGQVAIKTLIVHLAKTAVPDAPAIGTRIHHVESGVSGEIYEIAGRDAPRWIVRAATFPERR